MSTCPPREPRRPSSFVPQYRVASQREGSHLGERRSAERVRIRKVKHGTDRSEKASPLLRCGDSEPLAAPATAPRGSP
jgi:hypothetical protein